MKRVSKMIAAVGVFSLVLGGILLPVTVRAGVAGTTNAVSDTNSVSAENVAAEVAADNGDDAVKEAQVDWFKKMKEGGATMIFLGLLSVAGVVFAGEQLIYHRRKYIDPDGLADKVIEKIDAEDVEGVEKLCKGDPSTLAKIVLYIINHRDHSLTDISNSVGDIAGREMREMNARNNSLSVIAALAPLLGLLGTMIGMIEAFQLVSIYGDEGGASMLAGSIAKALITTAAGLIIAIPAIAAYNYFKHRINKLMSLLENDVEKILDRIS